MRRLLVILGVAVALLGGGLTYTQLTKPKPVACGVNETFRFSPFANQKVCVFIAQPDRAAQSAWVDQKPSIKVGEAELMGPEAGLVFKDMGVEADPKGLTEGPSHVLQVCNKGSEAATQFSPSRLLVGGTNQGALFGYDYVVGTKFQPKVVNHHEQWTIHANRCLTVRLRSLLSGGYLEVVYAGANGVPVTNQSLLLLY